MPYQRKVDKNKIPTCSILGVAIADINMDWLIRFTAENIARLAGDYMCVSNVHTTVMAYEDQAYREIQNGGIMAVPDGGPLSFVGRKRGHKGMERTTGPDYLEEILRISKENGYKHYFYGSLPNTLAKLKNEIEERFPGTEIVGMYSPPFRPLTQAEDAEIIEAINKVNPDFIWIGLGAPKQEKWMAEHQGKVNGFMVGVGAAFDYMAGNIERAPDWMQKSNLEWCYRLLQDPKRLFKRYFTTNTKFIVNAMIRGK